MPLAGGLLASMEGLESCYVGVLGEGGEGGKRTSAHRDLTASRAASASVRYTYSRNISIAMLKRLWREKDVYSCCGYINPKNQYRPALDRRGGGIEKTHHGYLSSATMQ